MPTYTKSERTARKAKKQARLEAAAAQGQELADRHLALQARIDALNAEQLALSKRARKSSRRGHLARVALCLTGCKNTAGKLFDIGHGGCNECVKFKRQTVAQQCVIGARLIGAENERLREAAVSAIPMPTSPNKEAKQVAILAQNIHVSMQYAAEKASRDFSKQTQPIQKACQAAKKHGRDPSEFDLEDEKLFETAVVGVEVDIRPSFGMGNGLLIMVRLPKGKRGADYMGHRLFKDGSTAMFCKKT
jgi:hypothetical protein